MKAWHLPGFFVSFLRQLPGLNFEWMSKVKEIRQWLHADGDYEAGVLLYCEYGADEFLKRMYAVGETAFNARSLREELEGICGQVNETVVVEDVPVFSTLKRPLAEYPRGVRELILKAGNLYKQAKKLHTELRLNKRMLAGVEELMWPYLSMEERKANALNILKLFEENRRCWMEVQFFEEHGKVLSPGKQPAFDLPEGNADLKLEVFRLRPLVSKWRKRLGNATDPLRKSHCVAKLKEYEKVLAEAERRLNGAV